MPCFTPEPTNAEIRDYERSSNFSKYGRCMSDQELITYALNMCCEMGGIIADNTLLDELSEDTFEWYKHHVQRDKDLKRRELLVKIEQLRKQEKGLSTKLNSLEDEISQLQVELASI